MRATFLRSPSSKATASPMTTWARATSPTVSPIKGDYTLTFKTSWSAPASSSHAFTVIDSRL